MKQYAFILIAATLISAAAIWCTSALSMGGTLCRAPSVGYFASVMLIAIVLGALLTLLGNIFYYKTLKKLYALLIYAFTIILTIVSLFGIIKFNMLIDIVLLNIVEETNLRETLGFARHYIDFTSLAAAALIIIAAAYCWAKQNTAQRFAAKHKIVIYSLLICLTAFCLINEKSLDAMHSGRFLRFSYPLVGFIKAFKHDLQAKILLKDMLNDKTNRVNIVYAPKDLPKNFFIIIGESESRHFMGLYNDRYNTTPLCKALIDKENLFAFSDVISPQASTNLVMPYILSFISTDYGNQPIKNFDNVVDMFKKCGYKSFWLSAQQKISRERSFAYSIYSASRCDCAEYLSPWKDRDADNRFTDALLLPLLDKHLEQSASESKNLFVLHLMGSHLLYKERYPKSFNKFNEADVQEELRPGVSAHDAFSKSSLASYMNSVLFTDYILNEIVKRVENSDAALVYISDHADELWQDGYNGHNPANASRYMVEIPMLIWVSNTYKAKRKSVIEGMKRSLAKPFMTDDLPHVICDLTGIKTAQYKPQKSLINPEFIPKTRTIGGKAYQELRHYKNEIPPTK